jgi:hypothetical protein
MARIASYEAPLNAIICILMSPAPSQMQLFSQYTLSKTNRNDLQAEQKYKK